MSDWADLDIVQARLEHIVCFASEPAAESDAEEALEALLRHRSQLPGALATSRGRWTWVEEPWTPPAGVAPLHNGDCQHPGLRCPYSVIP